MSTLTSSNWSLTLADGGALKSTTANSSELRPNTNVGTAQGWSLALTLTNNTSEAVTINSLTLDTIIYNSDGVYQGLDTDRDFVFTLSYGDIEKSSGNLTIGGNGTSSPTNGVVTLALDSAIELAANGSIDMDLDVAKGTNNLGCFLGLKAISAETTVPEPTTATLSLLALAGLAARRRRK